MHTLCKTFAILYLAILTTTAFAQSNAYSTRDAAIAATFPGKKFFEWSSAEGNLNGDDIRDIAMILTYLPEDGEREERLMVLTGMPGDKYSVLSVSSEYCHAQKFYNLEIARGSLFVTEVSRADSDGQITNILQFCFNNKINDLELIGRENISESFQDNSYERLNVNYTKGISRIYKKKHGHNKPPKNEAFQISPLVRLNGFDCIKRSDNAVH